MRRLALIAVALLSGCTLVAPDTPIQPAEPAAHHGWERLCMRLTVHHCDNDGQIRTFAEPSE